MHIILSSSPLLNHELLSVSLYFIIVEAISYGRTVSRFITREAGLLSYPASAIVAVLSKDNDVHGVDMWEAEVSECNLIIYQFYEHCSFSYFIYLFIKSRPPYQVEKKRWVCQRLMCQKSRVLDMVDLLLILPSTLLNRLSKIVRFTWKVLFLKVVHLPIACQSEHSLRYFHLERGLAISFAIHHSSSTRCYIAAEKRLLSS